MDVAAVDDNGDGTRAVFYSHFGHNVADVLDAGEGQAPVRRDEQVLLAGAAGGALHDDAGPRRRVQQEQDVQANPDHDADLQPDEKARQERCTGRNQVHLWEDKSQQMCYAIL